MSVCKEFVKVMLGTKRSAAGRQAPVPWHSDGAGGARLPWQAGRCRTAETAQAAGS